MTDCDICGKPAVTQAIVEGAKMSVCQRCLSFGQEVSRRSARPKPAAAKPPKEMETVEGYSSIVINAREKAKLTRSELARQLNMFENILERIESGALRPNEEIAKKLEKALSITLLEERKEGAPKPIEPEERHQHGPHGKPSRELTLADVVNIKHK